MYMTSSKRPTATDEEAVAARGTGRIANLFDRISVQQFLTRITVNKAAYTRLHSELSAARPEFELLVERADADGSSWVESGRDLLDRAEQALRRGRIEEAWRHLHTARRFEIHGLQRLDKDRDGDDERSLLDIRAAVVREEALANLDGWRRRSVVNLLSDEDEALGSGITGPELRSATRILQEHYEDIYLRRSERQRQFNQLALMGAASGLSLFLLSLADWLWEGSAGLSGIVADFLETPFRSGEIVLTYPGFALFVSIVGVMGASLFGMRSLRKRSLSTKIPQQINQLTVTSARGVIGAISALLFYFVLQTSLLQDGTILAEGAITAPMVVVVGFAAGYAERMAPSVVARVASITDSEGSDGSDSGSGPSP